MIVYEAPAAIAAAVSGIPHDAFAALMSGDGTYTVNVQLLDAAEMQLLNHAHRGIDRPTDVLSFPLYEGSLPPHDAPLGDLFICLEYVDESHMGVRECLIHGTLHLLGYDHETAETAWDKARAAVRVGI